MATANIHSPSIGRRPLCVIAFVVSVTVFVAPLRAADIFWNGGFNNSWQQEFNWDPFGSPFSIRRVPTDLDTVFINTPADDDLSLYGDSAPIDGLMLSNGITLRTNGHRLTVDDGGTAQVEVMGVGTLLSIEKITGNSAATSFDADNVRISSGRIAIVGAANIDGALDIRGTGRVSTAAGATVTVSRLLMAPTLFSSGELDLFGATTFHSTGAAQNTIGGLGSSTFNITGSSTATFDGRLQIGGIAGDPIVNINTFGRLFTRSLGIGGSSASTDTLVLISDPGSAIEQRDGATLTIGGDADDGSAIVRIFDSGRLQTSTGGVTINETGWVHMFSTGDNGGRFVSFSDMLIDGGRLSGSGDSTFTLAPGRDLRVQRGGRFSIDNYLNLGPGGEIDISDSEFAIDPFTGSDALGVGVGGGIGVGDAVVSAGGVATNFDINGRLSIGENGGSGTVRILNGAQSFVRFLFMGLSGVADSHGILRVESDADVAMFGSANIAGAGQNSTADVTVTGAGTTFTMGGNASVVVGNNTGFGQGSFDILDGSVLRLNTGSGAIEVRRSGVMNVTNAHVDAAGTGGFVNQGLLHVGAFGLINLTNSGSFDNTSGTVTGVGVIDLNGQIFDNGRGTLSPGSSAGELTLRDATLMSDANSIIDIELGGHARGQYDRLSIGGNATLDGTLMITLIDGFLPQMGDSFDIISAFSVGGGFDTLTCIDCAGRQFGVFYEGSLVRLVVTAVPLPATALLLLAALPGVLLRRRVRGVAQLYDGLLNAQSSSFE